MMRVPVTRRDPDGAAHDGTARVVLSPFGTPAGLEDFRDDAGEEMPLPPGASFVVDLSELKRLVADARELN